MMDKEVIGYLKLLHALFNGSVFGAFLYQGSLGLRIRSGRRRGHPQFPVIKRHRSFGPLLVILGLSGFIAGAVIVYLDHGMLFKYPAHSLIGSLIASTAVVLFLVSRRIRPGESPWRTAHLLLGFVLLSLYLFQVVLGLGILL